ncbi:MAG: ATP-binding cassette domain-containing protein [Planctomycetes bacterium]|jgi:iron(III) transport system ATP-binding protein|nr:ABC transporter ATP-binding protein [Phycisphaerae bacterium]NBB95740.1 ATP-binding cassette domain-containing protein [Planctomycetota bacterium]
MNGITVRGVGKTYRSGSREVEALRDIHLDIEDGEFFFLLGPSGCGKTTLLRIIAGLLDPTRGRIYLGDRDVTDQPVHKRNTAMVFQSYALWPHMSVYQNVEFGPKMRGVNGPARRDIAENNLERVQLVGFGDRKPNQLSGGQQQRVALARALSAGADCLLFDEPLSNLDARLRMHMRAELRQLVKDTGATAVYVTHDQKEALSMADRIAVLSNGWIVQVGTPEDVYNHPTTRFVADFLGEANFIRGEVEGTAPLAVLQTRAGPIRVKPELPPAKGTTVTCCVRPEYLTLHARPPQDRQTNSLSVRVVHQLYLGEIRQYVCELSNGTRWRASVLGEKTAEFRDDAPAWLCFRNGDATLLVD